MKLIDPIHFIGIGGAGMSSLAEIYHAQGYRVQGSDTAHSPTTDKLEALGIPVFLSHQTSNLFEAKTVVYSSAIPAKNPERLYASENNLLLLHRSDLLWALMEGKTSVTVAGTHGKTTTSFLLTHILQTQKYEPSYVIGGQSLDTGSSAHYNISSASFIAEADESDGSFLTYHPFGTIVTNIENDHLDFYHTLEALENAFLQHVNQVMPNGFVVMSADYPLTQNVQRKATRRIGTFGFSSHADLQILNVKTSSGHTLGQFKKGPELASFSLSLLGKHNVENAAGAVAAAVELGVSFPEAVRALSSFQGVKKRWQIHYQDDELYIIEDYAHNPGKIQAAVSTAKEAFPDRQVVVIFQPHRFSRLATAYEEFLRAFVGADHVITLPVYSVRDQKEATTDYDVLIAGISQHSSTPTSFAPTQFSLEAFVLALLTRPTVLLLVGAGNIHEIADLLQRALCESPKKEEKRS